MEEEDAAAEKKKKITVVAGGIPQAALEELVARLKWAALLNLPSSSSAHQRQLLAEFVRVHVLAAGNHHHHHQECDDDGDDGDDDDEVDEDEDEGGTTMMEEKSGRTMGLFLYLAGQGLASPDMLNELFRQIFPADHEEEEEEGEDELRRLLQQQNDRQGAVQRAVAAAAAKVASSSPPEVVGFAATKNQHEKKARAASSASRKRQRKLQLPITNGSSGTPEASKKQRCMAAMNASNERWERNYALLREWSSAKGHCRVPHSCVFKDAKLGDWVHRQRKDYSDFLKGRAAACITLERIGKLNAIGFDWTLLEKRRDFDAKWDEKFELLRVFRREFGHCRVPKRAEYKSVRLGRWVSRQREVYRNFMEDNGKEDYKTLERIVKLNAVGFEWTLQAEPSAEEEAPALEMTYKVEI